MKKELEYSKASCKKTRRGLLTMIAALMCLMQAASALAQTRDVSGVIVDEAGNPVIGVTVIVDGTTRGTTSNAQGSFTISAQPGERLRISSIGYVTQTVPVSTGGGILRIVLEEDATSITGIVVTALGITRQEKSLTYNVQTIGTGELVKTNDANFMSGLAGKVAGATINSSAAGIGGGTRVVMRGTKSMSGNNNVLYVINGIPLPNFNADQPEDKFEGAGQSGDGIANFNPEDIESISVLSGAAAAALYGIQAANGVILLTTKKGAAGEPSISISNNTSFYSVLRLPEFQNTYGSEQGEWYSWSAKMTDSPNYNPKDFFQTGYNVSNNVSVSTGGDKNQTYVSAGNALARGIIQNNTFNRYNATVRNTTSLFDDRLNIDLSFMYSKIREQNMQSQGEYANALPAVYLFPRGDDIEKYKYYERYNVERNIKTQYWPLGDNGLSMQNPYWSTNRNIYFNNKDRYITSAALSYKITDWLTVAGRIKLDKNVWSSEKKIYASSLLVLAENSQKGSYTKTDYKTTHTYSDFIATFNKDFGGDNWNITANVGGSIDNVRNTQNEIGGGLKAVPNIFILGNLDLDSSPKYSSNNYHDRINSVFGTAMLGYKNMAFLDASVRTDWMSVLYGTPSASITYPSVGVSGVITEIFDIRNDYLNFAKLRFTWSEVGNGPGRHRAITTYQIERGALITSSYGQVNLEPERTRAYEAGLNMKLFKNRLSVDFTLYLSDTKNQFFEPSSNSPLFSKIYINGGNVRNKGIEFSAGYKQNLGPVKWNSDVIWSLNRNKITKMLDAIDVNIMGYPETLHQETYTVYRMGGAEQRLTIGGSIGDIYVNQMRVDDQTGYIYVHPTTGALEKLQNEYVYAGKTTPNYNLSWRNSWEWKGLELGVLITARVGGIGVSATQAIMDYYGVSKRTAVARDNGGETLYGNYQIDAQSWYQTIGSNGTDFIGSYYVYSMTNVRLGEVTLNYDIPINKYARWIKGINVGVYGKNLAFFYCKAPFDPESTASTDTYNQGMDYFMQPSMRNIGFSVKLRF